MAIDKIGGVSNISAPLKSREITPKTNKTIKKDSIEISPEGKKAAEIANYTKVLESTPNIRTELVNNIKNKINSGSYDFNDINILTKTANKITSSFLK